jgi:sugar phosphate isomerase/epimerase
MIRKVIAILQIARDWRIHIAVLHPSWEPIASEIREQRIQACIRSLPILTKEAKALGIQLALECLPRTCLGNTGAEMRRLLEASPDLGVCVDVNHLVQELPETFIRELGPRIITTHISDNDGLDEKHWMPGEGVIHWREVMEALADIGYRGAFMYEVAKMVPNKVMENWRHLVAVFENEA